MACPTIQDLFVPRWGHASACGQRGDCGRRGGSSVRVIGVFLIGNVGGLCRRFSIGLDGYLDRFWRG